MASFSIPSRKPRSSGTISKPLAISSRSLLRKLRNRPQSLAQISESDEAVDAPIPSPRIGSAEDDCVLYNAVSGLMDVDSLRDRGPRTNSDTTLSKSGFLYVVNPDPERQSLSKEHSDLSLSLEWGKLSISPRPSIASMDVQDQNSYQDSDIVPAPLRLTKVPFTHNPANSKLYSMINPVESHSDDSRTVTVLADKTQPKSPTEKALERHLADVEHQTAELRKTLTVCEAKVTQMANELLSAKSGQLTITSESSSEQSRSNPLVSGCSSSTAHSSKTRDQDQETYKTFLDVDISQDAKQVALLSHVNLVGMSAQRRRRRLPQALVG